MMQKLDGLTAARIRLFKATGMASPRMLPFDRPSDLRTRPTVDNAAMGGQGGSRTASNVTRRA